jgi:hypothetical protein
MKKLWHWLRGNRSSRPAPSRSPRPGFRPALEALESRTTPSMTPGNGHVLAHVRVNTLFLGQAWVSDPTLNSYRTALNTFFQNITNSPYMDMLGQYGVGRGGKNADWVIYNGGPTNLPDQAPANQYSVQGVVSFLIGNGTLPAEDGSQLYFVFPAPGTAVYTPDGMSSNNPNPHQAFLGYHSSFPLAGRDTYYAVIPFPGNGNYTVGGLADLPLDGMTKVASHELAEAVTDPVPGTAWEDRSIGAEGEVGDIYNDMYLYWNGYVVQRIVDVHDRVMDQPYLPAQGTNASATAGTPFWGEVARFSDQSKEQFGAVYGLPGGTPLSPSDFTQVTIDWGDSQTTAGQVISAGNGLYQVVGVHTYAQPGTMIVRAHVVDKFGAETYTSALFTVNRPAFSAMGWSVTAAAGQPYTGPVALVSESTPADASAYTAQVNWGDGQSGSGQLVRDSGGTLFVYGTHTYAQGGTYTLSVQVTKPSTGDTDTGLGSATVTAAAPPPAATPPAHLAAVAGALTHSAEYYGNLIQAAYRRYLGRAAAAGEVQLWTGALQGGLSDERMEAGFIGSPEYIQDHGGQGAGWVTGLYQDLLGRTPNQAEVAAWMQALAGGMAPSDVAYGFAAGAEREGQRVATDYQHYLSRSPNPAEVAAWVGGFLNGLSNEDVIAGFVGSPEYFARHGGGGAAWLAAAYQDILGRSASEAEVQAWLPAL